MKPSISLKDIKDRSYKELLSNPDNQNMKLIHALAEHLESLTRQLSAYDKG